MAASKTVQKYAAAMELWMKMTTENEDENFDNGAIGKMFSTLSWLLLLLTFPFSLFFCFKVVHEYERAVIFRLGRIQSGGSRGIFFVLPCIEDFVKVDIRSFCFDVPPQEVLTRDSVTVTVDAVVYGRVYNAQASILNVNNAHESTKLLSQTQLRNVIGTKILSEILSEREGIAGILQAALNDGTASWGIYVERVEIKDVRLPLDLQRAMAAEAEASRGAAAKVIAAKGEQDSSKALKEAADILSESPVALQLRYLQSIVSISGEKESTIVFPLPVDLIPPSVDTETPEIEYQRNLLLRAKFPPGFFNNHVL